MIGKMLSKVYGIMGFDKPMEFYSKMGSFILNLIWK
jgi:hypothetical protein